MKTTILLWSMVSALATVFAAENTEPAQTISLSDGTKITFLGITYGKHHEAPKFEGLGGDVRKGRWIDRSNDVTVAWVEFEHDPTNFPNYSLFVSDTADANGIAFRNDFKAINHVRAGVDVEGYELTAYPRWDKQFYLGIYSTGWSPRRLSSEKFIATNPDLKAIGNVVTETLPVTKTNGDLTVTLTNLVSGAPQPPYTRDDRILPLDPVRRPAPAQDDPVNQSVRFGFDLKQNGRSATNWQLASVDISDAVGNHVETTVQFQDNERMRHAFPFIKTPADDYKGYVFWPGLWPNEPAWNVRLEFTRDSGFSEDEIVTFTNVPVKHGTDQDLNHEASWDGISTNFSFIPELVEKNVQGVRLRIPPPLIVPESTPGREYLRVNIFAEPMPESAMKLTLLQATDDKGNEIPTPPLSKWAGYHFAVFSDPPDIKTLNLKFALHRSRYVTFTVKPNRQ